jgi:hypothetical protein
VVHVLQSTYGWTDEYIESLDFERFHGKVTLLLKLRREEQEAEEKRWRIGLLVQSRSISFGLQANSELPPSKAEANQKKPDWTKIEQARREMMKFMEAHQKALSHPWYFEEYMGLGHIFDKPEVEVAEPIRLKTRADIDAMKERLIAKLKMVRETQGNIDLSQTG